MDGFREFDPSAADAGRFFDEPRPAHVPPTQDVEPLIGFKVSDLSGLEVPQRQWHIEGMMPGRNVTLFMANGGDGKSLIALQLSVATALGRLWFGRQCKTGSVLYLSCEDERPEIHARLRDIAYHDGIQLADLSAIEVVDLVGKDAVLAIADKHGQMATTEFWQRFRGALERTRPVLAVLDTVADMFGGDEIKKVQVRQFISRLRGLCIEFDLAILLIGHPSQSGISSGEGTSGNVAWNNSVRARWYLERVRSSDKDEATEPDPNARRLTVKKTNYGTAGETINLRWTEGVFTFDDQAPPLRGPVAAAHAEAVFLELLREFCRQGRRVSPSPSKTYAPTVFSREPDAKGITSKAFEAAMSALFKADRIQIDATGPPSKRREHIAFAAPSK